MKKKILPFGTAVSLTWIDSKAQQGWTNDPDKPRDIAIIRTLGRVTANNKFALSVTTSIANHKETMDDLSIPWGCIYELEVLKEQSL